MTAIQFQVRFVNECSTNKFGTSSIYNRKQYPYMFQFLLAFWTYFKASVYPQKEKYQTFTTSLTQWARTEQYTVAFSAWYSVFITNKLQDWLTIIITPWVVPFFTLLSCLTHWYYWYRLDLLICVTLFSYYKNKLPKYCSQSYPNDCKAALSYATMNLRNVGYH